MVFTLTHTIEIDVPGFWKLFFDAEFNHALYCDFLNFKTYELEEWTDDDGVLYRHIEYTPTAELPAAARKLVGDGGYAEIGRFTPALAKYSARWVPRFAADKFLTKLELWAEPRGPRCCERVVTFENTAKNLFGLKTVVERLSEQAQRGMMEKVAEFNNRWIRERGLCSSSEG